MSLLGKVQEFINPTPIEDKYQELLRRAHEEILKPLGFKKDGQNFRQIAPDGLGKIVNFRKDKWNQKDRRLGFLIYTGVYFEPEPAIKNRAFKEYDCQLRQLGQGIRAVWSHLSFHQLALLLFQGLKGGGRKLCF